jgi:hypothetical protein
MYLARCPPLSKLARSSNSNFDKGGHQIASASVAPIIEKYQTQNFIKSIFSFL